MNTPTNQPTTATNQAPRRHAAFGAGAGEVSPDNCHIEKSQELSSVRRILFPDLSVDTDVPPASGPSIRRVGHIVEVIDTDGSVIKLEVLIDTTDRTPPVQRTVSSHGDEPYPTSLAAPLYYLEGEFDTPLPFQHTESNQDVHGHWVCWRQLPNNKFVWDPQWISDDEKNNE